MALIDRADAETEPAESFLQQVGGRVRAARARHGMTRKDLAKHSGVSERHLAQLESGKGNISIVLLRQVAGALSTPMAGLLEDTVQGAPDRRLLDGILDRLSLPQLAEARRLMQDRFAQDLDREKRLTLIGLRGAGKSTVGRLVARRSGVSFIELAEKIEQMAGMNLSEIFEFSGQAGYRRLEREALSTILDSGEPFVMATGGGIVSDPSTFQFLLQHSFTVWLKAAPEAHMARVVEQGDQRPMAGNREAMQDLNRILETREPLYAKADRIVDTTGLAPEMVADRVMRHWKTQNP
ncbi:MAG: helix-turn-helix transcriptional regulator [Minwuia sp.]|uniref:helix-turn-helix transcriptional regulator n=1 Tax=Minwuia sp. TaxID=2493630 RepID=UPI003A860EAE